MKLYGVCVTAGLLASGSAWAWPASVAWPGYVYEGPGKQFHVIDEISRGQPMEVLACDGAWCRVAFERKTAYVMRASIQPLAGPVPTSAPLAGACFDTRVTGYKKGEVWRTCEEQAAAK